MAAKAEQLSVNSHYELDRQLRTQTDTETWLAETLNGSMRTNFEFWSDGHELYGEDGGKLREVFEDAIETAQLIIQANPSLSFELRRRLVERGELDDMEAMSRGELPNTMVVLSDFPQELMDSTEDVGGYNTTRRQTMLRVITREAEGTIRITSQSLDGSNRQALESIYQSLGKEPAVGELLEQRIYIDLPAEWQSNLINNLTETYDNSLTQQHGGRWHAGRPQPNQQQIGNTYDFVRQQADLINWFVEAKLDNPVAAENLRYKLAATAKERFERQARHAHRAIPTDPIHHSSLVSVEAIAASRHLQMELDRAEQRAMARNETFSGCGATIRMGRRRRFGQLEDGLDSLGFGNQSDDKESSKDDDGECEFVSKSCPSCGVKNVKTTVTKTHIKGTCGCSKRK
jgi:hypothetical protein